jgi:transcriptional regulator with XRE-family HTH domain
LFDEKRKPDGKPYSQREIIEGLQGAITPVYLWKLREGHASNPSMQVIRSLADFFGVDPGYFFQSDALQAVSAEDHLQNDWAHKILNRLSHLDPGEQEFVLLMIESMLKLKKSKRLKK